MGANQSHVAGQDQATGRRRRLAKRGTKSIDDSSSNPRHGPNGTHARSMSTPMGGSLSKSTSIYAPGNMTKHRSASTDDHGAAYWHPTLSPTSTTNSTVTRTKVVIPHRPSMASSHHASSTFSTPALQSGTFSNAITPTTTTSFDSASSGNGNGNINSDAIDKSLSPLAAHNARVKAEQGHVDTQTGERADFTNIWHSLAHKTSAESLWSTTHGAHIDSEIDTRPPGEPLVASLSPELWQHIASFLSPADATSLTIASHTLLDRIGHGTLATLGRKEHLVARVGFLLHMEAQLPDQLLCFNCGAYHRRLNPGNERLLPAGTLNLLVACPQAHNPTVYVPRLRLVPGWNLPFALAQLAQRHQRLGPSFGIRAASLDRRWTDRASSWTHATSFFVDPNSGHLLMRVASQCPAQPDLPPAGIRHLLFDKADYTPHFSVCAHWRDGELMPIVRCALGHIPPSKGPGFADRVAASARREISQGVTGGKPVAVGGGTGPAGQCALCRPMRRCPECPTEYLVELRLVEDRRRRDTEWGEEYHPVGPGSVVRPFNSRVGVPRMVHCVSVTRWSDLGDGAMPFRDEWAACVGAEGAGSFDSLAKVGSRTIAGTFEARFGESNAGQRVLNLNPKGEKKGIEGHRWW